MHHDLKKLKTSMDIHQYTLKDLALYFERFDGYVCKIKRPRNIGSISKPVAGYTK